MKTSTSIYGAHALEVYDCPLCGARCRGNGGRTSHIKAHHRRGEFVTEEVTREEIERKLVESRAKSMTEDEYRTIQDQVVLLGQFAARLELDAWLRKGALTSTIAPMIDPTLWRRGSKQFELVRELAQAARDLKRKYEKFRDQYPAAETERKKLDAILGVNEDGSRRG